MSGTGQYVSVGEATTPRERGTGAALVSTRGLVERKRGQARNTRAPGRHGGALRSIRSVLVWLGFVGLAALTVYPIFWIVSTALKTSKQFADNELGVPTNPSLGNVRAVLHLGFGGFLLNSLVVTLGAVIVVVVVACPAGFVLGRIRMRFTHVAVLAIVLCMMVPPAMMVVPLFQVTQSLGLLNSLVGLVIVEASLNVPVSVFLMSGFFSRLPPALLEAARVDGAGIFRAFVYIMLPLVRSGVITLMVLNGLWVWNEFFFATVFISSPPMHTAMAAIGAMIAQSNTQFSANIPQISAALCLAAIPPVLLFILAQRFVREGLTQGALRE